MLLIVAKNTNIKLNRPKKRPTTPINYVYSRKTPSAPQKPRNLYREWASEGDNASHAHLQSNEDNQLVCSVGLRAQEVPL